MNSKHLQSSYSFWLLCVEGIVDTVILYFPCCHLPLGYQQDTLIMVEAVGQDCVWKVLYKRCSNRNFTGQKE